MHCGAWVYSKPKIHYQARQVDQTLLYQIVKDHYQTFEGSFPPAHPLPRYIRNEFEAYLKCGVLAHGFLVTRCKACEVEKLVAFSCKKRGFCPSCGARRMQESATFLSESVIPKVPVRQWVLSVPIPMRYWLATNPSLTTAVLSIINRALTSYYKTKARVLYGLRKSEAGSVVFIQRFGSALNLNIHFHILFLDGVYDGDGDFYKVQAPSQLELQGLIEKISERLCTHLTKKGYLSDDRQLLDTPETYLDTHQSLKAVVAASTQSKSLFGERPGYPTRRFGVLEPSREKYQPSLAANHQGFSLHAGVSVAGHDRKRLERLIGYMARSSVSLDRLSLNSKGELRYQFKKSFSDGSTHAVFSPLELLEKLAALVPLPRIHLTRYFGVLGPNHHLRSKVVPKLRGKKCATDEAPPHTNESKRISWARLLKRVFEIDISVCDSCGGELKVSTAVLERHAIQVYLRKYALPTEPPEVAPARPPPQATLAFLEHPI